MCRSIDYPSHSHINPNGERGPFTITNLDFNELVPKEKNTMLVAKTKNIKHTNNYKLKKLEDIPEETELEDETHPELEEACVHLEMDLQVLRKSLDMGLCVLCLGVGYMVSTKFRPRPKFSSLLSSSSFLFF